MRQHIQTVKEHLAKASSHCSEIMNHFDNPGRDSYWDAESYKERARQILSHIADAGEELEHMQEKARCASENG